MNNWRSVFALLLAGGLASPFARAQEAQNPQPAGDPDRQPHAVDATPLPTFAGGLEGSAFLGVPVRSLFPGNVPIKPGLQAPRANQAEAATRGMRYFNQMNCVGCHGANGGGGMGPALSNAAFIYGDKPEQIFLSIYQGRPHGMPAWGAMLPAGVIWDLVAYVKSISREPSPQWGKTIAPSPPQEQVPAEYVTSTDPWSHLETFSHGQKPNSAK